ncbi:UDP-glucose 4-epimerase [Alloactinosynnema sp. L-07]|uniref:NAD-dependent epimerase/dehydratase family protein n=1 Tax=Alloactinosynnema sp. L-07 TaxID=1653480 RepID=UPI00065F091E|nr:NAD-dependent epimerase/dehydratase family protein [Alloactinosynnema sp. L-07]CRK61964.1 UDP-glucose 4-epimerase [Alloactinosynnema sp. L-07]
MPRRGDPVLITGGSGFIGTHLAGHLAARGLPVVVADRVGWTSAGPRVRAVPLDVTDADGCRDLVRSVRPAVVYHLAAAATIDAAFADPLGSLRTNVCGTVAMLEATRSVGGGARFVLASTDKVYGELRTDAYTESSPLAARGVYDVGKQSADTITQLYRTELGLPVAILRLCNVFGPGDPHTASRVVPRSLDRIFDPRGPLPPLLYAGSLGHGRDYVFIDDVVRALVAVGFDARADGEVFNMAATAHRTTRALVEEIVARSSAACLPADPDRAAAIAANGYTVVAGPPARALDRQHCDAGLLRTRLGFRPAVPLGVGLDRTIAAVMLARGLAAAPSNGAARGYGRAVHT